MASLSGTSVSPTSTYSKSGNLLASSANNRSRSAKAFSCAKSTRSFATATTSLWKAPAAIASSDCWTNRVRFAARQCSRAIAFACVNSYSTPRCQCAGERGRGRRSLRNRTAPPPRRRAPSLAACDWPRPHRRTTAPADERRSCAHPRKLRAIALVSPAIRGFGAASTEGWLR